MAGSHEVRGSIPLSSTILFLSHNDFPGPMNLLPFTVIIFRDGFIGYLCDAGYGQRSGVHLKTLMVGGEKYGATRSHALKDLIEQAGVISGNVKM